MQKTIKLFQKIARAVAPPPKITVSEWADQNRILSRDTSSEPGPWRTARTPYLREIMDAVKDRDTEEVAIMTSSQVGKSEALNNTIASYIDCDPCPMLMIQPTIEMAEDYSKRRIAPMIRDTPAIAEKVSDSKTRDTNNTILNKIFPGGSLTLAGANSPAGLASRNIRIILADEIDRYPASAGTEGDPLALAEKRTITFWNKKKIYTSTPGIKGISRIEKEYLAGTQERWCLKCPNCGEYQFLNLHGMKFEHSKDEKDNYAVWNIVYQCPDCGFKYDEQAWKSQEGAWVAQNPKARKKKIRSFHLNAFYSPWLSWEKIILDWLESKRDPELLKVFTNTMLGVPWEEKGEIEDYQYLLDRREEYPADLQEGVLILTCGVDVQNDRLEYEIVGWGKGEQSWGIEYGRIMGSPDQKDTWQMLDDKLNQVFYFEDGTGFKIACTFIDSGYFTSKVYSYCKANEHRRIFAIKGQGGPGIPLINKIYRSKKENAAVFILGVDDGKSKIMSRLKIKQEGDGYCHFPLNDNRGYDQIYFQGLISEHLVKRKTRGKIVLSWEKINTDQRNEPLDLRNYAQAALQILSVNFEKLAERLKESTSLGAKPVNKTAKNTKKRTGLVKKCAQI